MKKTVENIHKLTFKHNIHINDWSTSKNTVYHFSVHDIWTKSLQLIFWLKDIKRLEDITNRASEAVIIGNYS